MSGICSVCGGTLDKWIRVKDTPPKSETYLWGYNVLTGDKDWGLFFGEIKKQDGQDVLVMKRKLYTHYNLLSRVPTVSYTHLTLPTICSV